MFKFIQKYYYRVSYLKFCKSILIKSIRLILRFLRSKLEALIAVLVFDLSPDLLQGSSYDEKVYIWAAEILAYWLFYGNRLSILMNIKT